MNVTSSPSGASRATVWRPIRAAVLLAAALPCGAGLFGEGPAADPAADGTSVAVAAVARRDLSEELSVQAEIRPYQEVELYSRVAGYLKSIPVDLGDRVAAGDVIATLEVPELQSDLDRAKAAQDRSEADYEAAHLDYGRIVDVDKSQPNLLAHQDLDLARSRDRSLAAAVAAAKADVEKYQTILAYTRIAAPFGGIVTARTADPGAMIQTSSGSPIVRLSQTDRLRLDFPVPLSSASEVHPGDPAEIRLERPAGLLHASVTRVAGRISSATRTMTAEIELPNPDLKLIPGMYATVILQLNRRPAALALPIEAVGSTANPTVYLVNSERTIEERPVTLGLETPSYCEILTGLREGDLVVVGSRSGIAPGRKVNPRTLAAAALP